MNMMNLKRFMRARWWELPPYRRMPKKDTEVLKARIRERLSTRDYTCHIHFCCTKPRIRYKLRLWIVYGGHTDNLVYK